MVYDQSYDRWGYPITTATTPLNWSQTSYYSNYSTNYVVQTLTAGPDPSYHAAAQPPQPPPIALALCTRKPFPKLVIVDGRRFAWFPKRQTCTKERSSRRRRLRTWEK